jgi:hypothetical protein
VFGYTFEEIGGQNIKITMPHSIAERHDYFLDNFIKNSCTVKPKDENYLFFPKHKNGFVVPLKKHLKLELYGQDLGVLAFLEQYT